MYDESRAPIDVAGLGDGERLVVEHVQEYGTHVMHVEDDVRNDGFSYTIGLQYHHDHPELIVFGGKSGWRQWLLNAMRDEILGGACFAPGLRYAGILDNYRLAVTAVPDAMLLEYFGAACWFYRELVRSDAPLRAVQVVWPDLADVLPWEPGYTAQYRQPILAGTKEDGPAA